MKEYLNISIISFAYISRDDFCIYTYIVSCSYGMNSTVSRNRFKKLHILNACKFSLNLYMKAMRLEKDCSYEAILHTFLLPGSCDLFTRNCAHVKTHKYA